MIFVEKYFNWEFQNAIYNDHKIKIKQIKCSPIYSLLQVNIHIYIFLLQKFRGRGVHCLIYYTKINFLEIQVQVIKTHTSHLPAFLATKLFKSGAQNATLFYSIVKILDHF